MTTSVRSSESSGNSPAAGAGVLDRPESDFVNDLNERVGAARRFGDDGPLSPIIIIDPGTLR